MGILFLLVIIIMMASIITGFVKANEYVNRKSNIKRRYRKNPSREFKNHFFNLSKEERNKFFSTLEPKYRQEFKDYLYNNANQNPRRDEQMFNNIVNENMLQQFNDWAMSECMKGVTSFDEGGYVMGEGFNPSDTMNAEMNNQMNDMNSHMNDMNNFGGGGGCGCGF